MGNEIVVAILWFLVGGLILWATFSNRSYAPGITLCIGLYFIAVPVCLMFKWYKAFALLLTIPLGGLWTLMAVLMVIEPFKYCIRGEGTYIKPVFDHASKSRRSRGIKYYGLECNFRSNGRGYQRKSEDSYTLDEINKRYTEGGTVAIWIKRKNPMQFKVRRWKGFGAGLLLLLIGVGFIEVAVRVIFGGGIGW